MTEKARDEAEFVKRFPVETEEEIESLKKATRLELLLFSPRLQRDFPEDAEKPTAFWVK